MTITRDREGGCQCGAIRYRLLAPPDALYACHCRDCQKQSSSAFGLSMWVARDAISFSGASPRIYTTRGDSGAPKHCAFCPTCGTRIYHASADDAPLSIKAGSLDDAAGIVPTSHLWTSRAHRWLAPVLDRACCYEREPDDDETLRAQWRASAEDAPD